MPKPRQRARSRRLLDLMAVTGLTVGAMSLLQPRMRAVSGRGSQRTPPSAYALAEGYEATDFNTRAVALILGGMAATTIAVIVIVLVMGWRFSVSDRATNRGLTAEETTQPVTPAPHLQRNPFDDLADLKKREAGLLNSYGWTAADHTTAHVPISRARAIAVGRSLDASP